MANQETAAEQNIVIFNRECGNTYPESVEQIMVDLWPGAIGCMGIDQFEKNPQAAAGYNLVVGGGDETIRNAANKARLYGSKIYPLHFGTAGSIPQEFGYKRTLQETIYMANQQTQIEGVKMYVRRILKQLNNRKVLVEISPGTVTTSETEYFVWSAGIGKGAKALADIDSWRKKGLRYEMRVLRALLEAAGSFRQSRVHEMTIPEKDLQIQIIEAEIIKDPFNSIGGVPIVPKIPGNKVLFIEAPNEKNFTDKFVRVFIDGALMIFGKPRMAGGNRNLRNFRTGDCFRETRKHSCGFQCKHKTQG